MSNHYPVYSSVVINTFFILLFFRQYSIGISQKELSLNALKEIKVRMYSAQEQQKNTAVLINADKKIELLRQQLAKFKPEGKALMQQLLTGKRRINVNVMEVV
jgi:type I restriction enzyme S subunit